MALMRPKELLKNRHKPLKVLVSDAERDEIAAKAAGSGLSVSAYLRALGLGHRPPSIFDHQAILSMMKVNADQGRLGGLLKLWLSSRPRAGAGTGEVRRVLHQIEELQIHLRQIIDSL